MEINYLRYFYFLYFSTPRHLNDAQNEGRNVVTRFFKYEKNTHKYVIESVFSLCSNLFILHYARRRINDQTRGRIAFKLR